MAKRYYRELSDDVRKKISDSMKEFHSKRTIDSKRATSEKQSASMLHYWSGIRSKKNEANE